MVSPFDAAPQSPPPIGLTHAEMERERQWHQGTANDPVVLLVRAEKAEARVRELEAEIVSIRAEVAAEMGARR